MKSYFKKPDLHLHTAVSDGTDTPREIIEKVKAAEIDVFSVTDHDSIKTSEIIPDLSAPGDPVFLSGVEFSCKDENGKYHILGYGYDPAGKSIRAVVDKGHNMRMYKVRARLEFIDNEYGFRFPKNEIDALLSLDNPGKPHIGNLMVKYGYAETKEQAIKEFIDKLHIKSEYLRPEEAINGIINSGGVPVLAHPFFGSGDQLILGSQMDERLKYLISYGLKGVEAFYSGFTPKLIKNMLEYAEKYDLYVTAGSDYHGSNKLVKSGDTGMIPGEIHKRMKSFFDVIL